MPRESLAAAPRGANVLWAAGHETGDISEWLVNGGGPEVTDAGEATAQRGLAHSGRYALRLSIEGADGTAGDQAIRMFRWRLVDDAAITRRRLGPARLAMGGGLDVLRLGPWAIRGLAR